MGVDDNSWLLDSDELWATEAIDDTQTLINLVEKAASEVLALQPDDDLAKQCVRNLKELEMMDGQKITLKSGMPLP